MIVLHRYMFMLQCWELDPERRPPFFNLVELLSNYLESIADYVDLKTKSPESVNIESGI